jgi:hypothetical protein
MATASARQTGSAEAAGVTSSISRRLRARTFRRLSVLQRRTVVLGNTLGGCLGVAQMGVPDGTAEPGRQPVHSPIDSPLHWRVDACCMGGIVPVRLVHPIRRCHDLHLFPPHSSALRTCGALPLRLRLHRRLHLQHRRLV